LTPRRTIAYRDFKLQAESLKGAPIIPTEPELTANFVGAIQAVAELARGEVKNISGVI